MGKPSLFRLATALFCSLPSSGISQLRPVPLRYMARSVLTSMPIHKKPYFASLGSLGPLADHHRVLPSRRLRPTFLAGGKRGALHVGESSSWYSRRSFSQHPKNASLDTLYIDQRSRDALLYAATYQWDRLKSALSEGQPLELDSIDPQSGFSMLHLSINQGQEAIVQLLLERGANPNVVAQDGWAPLHMTLFRGWGNVRMAELLLQHGADIEARDGEGNTPFLTAVREGRTDVLPCLLASKADTEVANYKGKTWRQIAQREGRTDVIQWMRANRIDPACQAGPAF